MMTGTTGMTDTADAGASWRASRLRKAMWIAAAALLALPAVAMRVTFEVDWDGADFLIMGLLIAAACGAVEFGMRLSGHIAYRAGVVVGVGGAFLLVWINLAVGVLGSEDNAANLMYGAVLLTGMLGALLARFRARGLVRTLLAMSAVQVAVPLVALALGWIPAASLPEAVGVTLFFLAPWLLAAALFHIAHTDGGPRTGAA